MVFAKKVPLDASGIETGPDRYLGEIFT